MTTFLKLQTLLVEHLGINRQNIELSSLIHEDLGADSLDIVQIEMAVEEEWGLDINDDELPWSKPDALTVQQIVDYIEEREGR